VADRVGLELVTASGFDPISALGFFDKSAERDGGGIFADFHELPRERKSSLVTAAESFRKHVPVLRERAVNCVP
jgi:predicted Zn-dependent protease